MMSIISVDGQGFFNQPIYVGDGVPFLPQYHDFYDYFKRFGLDTLLPTE